MRSNKVSGILWLVAACLMIVGPVLFDGNKSIIAIGTMFLIFGLVSLRKK